VQRVESGSDVVLDRFTHWAADRADLRAAVVIGSRAATDGVPDQWSDTDIVLVSTAPKRLLNDARWLTSFGTPLLSCVASVAGETFRAAWFDGDVKFDFIIISRNQACIASAMLRLTTRLPSSSVLLPSGIKHQLDRFSETIGKGMRVLFDKDGSATALARVHVRRPAPRLPTAAEFQNAVRTFLSWALWTTKILSRGELWCAGLRWIPPTGPSAPWPRCESSGSTTLQSWCGLRQPEPAQLDQILMSRDVDHSERSR
jgi:hypothetical protein